MNWNGSGLVGFLAILLLIAIFLIVADIITFN